MGYTGVIVVGRSARLLVLEDGMEDFGHQQRYVRPLGDGWQLVETGGQIDALKLREPCRRLTMSTGHPVIAAEVFDSDWARLCTAVGGSAGPVARLHKFPDAGLDECGLGSPPGASGRAGQDAVSDLLAWSAVAGLPADPAAVRAAGTEDELADDAVFALVHALGVMGIGRTVPRAFPVEGWPFSPISTMAYLARMQAAGRERAGEPASLSSWQEAAIALDAQLWAAAYRPPVDVASLARQAIDVFAARSHALGMTNKRQDDLELLNTLLDRGRLNPEPEIANDHDRMWADQRATNPPNLHSRTT